jgi:enterochelin esterase-like enzyme
MTMRKETNAQTHPKIHVAHKTIDSAYLDREVKIEFYMPPSMEHPATNSLLLINDGQDLPKMHFKTILEELYQENLIEPVLCVGIHCGRDRRHEYGTAKILDYKERGSKASAYTKFIFQELLPFIRKETHTHHFKHKSFAGFSLGGLMAMDIVWNHPYEFLYAGVFSGSFWWRTKALDDGYVEATD